MNDESDHENDDGEFKANLSGLTNRNISTRRSGAIKVPDHFDGSKKKKIDDNDDVNVVKLVTVWNKFFICLLYILSMF